MKTVGIVGYGWVGKAMHKLFPTAIIHDPYNTNIKSWTRDDINKCDVVFVCVPTPMFRAFGSEKSGRLDCDTVEEVVGWLKVPLIVIRSTVNPGFCQEMDERYNHPKFQKRIVYQPEYLGETANHPFSDMSTRPFMIIGGGTKGRRMLIELYQEVCNANVTIRQVSHLEAEIIKLTENRAIAFKVAQCQELYDVCEAAGVDYYTIRDAVYGDDPRFNLWFTFVYPDNRGFNSKCIPKDVYAWAAWAETVGYEPLLTRWMLTINDKKYLSKESK